MTTMVLQEQPAVPIAPAELLPPIADGVEHPLDPRWVRVERIVGWIFTVPVAGILLNALVLGAVFAPLAVWIKTAAALVGLSVVAGLVWLAHRWPVVSHRHASYKVDAHGIEIRRGVVWRKVINVPRSRVQHTDVAQGPLERANGLATLVIYTAGTEHAKVDLRGLDHATALRLRDHLVAGEGDDAV